MRRRLLQIGQPAAGGDDGTRNQGRDPSPITHHRVIIFGFIWGHSFCCFVMDSSHVQPKIASIGVCMKRTRRKWSVPVFELKN